MGAVRTIGPSWVLLWALGAMPAVTHANGRFPAGGYLVVGPGAASDVIVVRATFGLLTSRDAGRTWGWTCEDALASSGMFDASVAIAADGAIVATTPRGLIRTRDGCGWSVPPGSPGRPVVDLSHDAVARRFVTAAGPSGADDLLLRSDDGGASWTAGARLPGFYTETVEVAPSSAARVYVSGYLRDGTPVLLRSDDGGGSAREVARGDAFLGGTSAFVSAVDPTDPDVVYVRSADGLGTLLLRSADGGGTFRRLARTDAEMAGFAISDDGATVWIGSREAREGILRSERGGPFVRAAATVSVRCLRQHAGRLYVCADELTDGFTVGCSRDGGEHVEPLLSTRDLTGTPAECGATTEVTRLCAPLWPTQRQALRSIDGGVSTGPGGGCPADAATFDAPAPDRDLRPEPSDATAPDAADGPPDARDAGPPLDGGAQPLAPPDCACGVPGRRAPRRWTLGLAALFFAKTRRVRAIARGGRLHATPGGD